MDSINRTGLRIPAKVQRNPVLNLIGILPKVRPFAVAVTPDFCIMPSNHWQSQWHYGGRVKINPEELVSQATAARMRGVSKQAIEGLIKRGRLTTIVIDDHTFLLRKEVEDYKPGVGGRPKSKSTKKQTRNPKKGTVP